MLPGGGASEFGGSSGSALNLARRERVNTASTPSKSGDGHGLDFAATPPAQGVLSTGITPPRPPARIAPTVNTPSSAPQGQADESWPSLQKPPAFGTPDEGARSRPAPPPPAALRLDILDRKVPWSWKPELAPPPPPQPKWDDYDAADDFVIEVKPKENPNAWMARWRERHPQASDDEAQAMVEARMKKMEMMQAAYCQSTFHFAAWIALYIALAAALLMCYATEIEAHYHDIFACNRPVLVWGCAFAWTLLITEPMFAFCWAFGRHVVVGAIEYDIIFHVRHVWTPLVIEKVTNTFDYLYIRYGWICGDCSGQAPKRAEGDDYDPDEETEEQKALRRAEEAELRRLQRKAPAEERRGSSGRAIVPAGGPDAGDMER